jgi:hypothetical protein
MTLSKFDLDSALWKQLEQHVRDRIEISRNRLESKNLNELETAFLRGEIKQLRSFLALANPSPDLTNSD